MEIDGVKILDSPLQNPGAHNVNMMLYISGSGRYDSAFPVEVYGENYRANRIDAADTQSLRIRTDNDIPIAMMATFATENRLPPFTEFLYNHGKITWQRDPNGQTQIYAKEKKAFTLIEELDNGDISLAERLLIDVIDAIQQAREPLSNIDNSLQHTLCINGLFESSPEIVDIDEQFILHKEVKSGQTFYEKKPSPATQVIIRDIETIIAHMFQNDLSFSEVGVAWAKPGRKVLIPKVTFQEKVKHCLEREGV
jgi:hypothetical protein